jgi:chemotaxis protein MotB
MQWIGLSFLGLALGSVGCVPAEKYNAMKLAHDSAMERLAQADSNANAAKAESAAYKKQLDAIMASGNNQTAMVANLTQQLTEMQGRYAELDAQYKNALQNTGVVQVLPEAVNNALTEFAQQNPDLVDFDSAHGVVKFKSDVTFNSGSAELRSEARNAIARFAQILNSPAASGYDLQIAGHTDSQRVSNPATVKAGHVDNWYLSAHRAISVKTALTGQSVNPQRIAVVGYADQHPVASNATEQGRAQNRRVEVLILPSTTKNAPTATADAGAAQPKAAAKAAPAKKAAKSELNKDAAATTDERPVLNK